MIQKIENDTSPRTVDVSIIPRLKNFNEITLSRGDTLVVYWDFERYPLDMAQDFFNIIQKAFPENQVLFVPIEVKMGVIKDGESMGTF
jgi:hypothetical protein